ncbi:exosome complex exonuclease RRP40 [Irpex lacteus]|nr:exosome complex exonuclease RRP40 [Irpex lacteus]
MTNVLPGESIPAKHTNLKPRPGLLQVSNVVEETAVVSTKVGKLKQSANNKLWWIESNARRYAPTAQESVVGVVISRSGEGWRVDIGAAHVASLDGTLDGLVFEGATKRNRSNLKVDSVIYAQVSLAHKDMEPELECLDAQTRKAGEFGELKGGLLTRCSPQMCRQMNVSAWVNSKKPKHVIAIVRAIEAADPDGGNMDELQVKKFLGTLDI